jgi:hypothetical protein
VGRVEADTSRRFDEPAAPELRVRDSGLMALDAQTESILETVSRRAQTAFEVLTIRKEEWRVKW